MAILRINLDQGYQQTQTTFLCIALVNLAITPKSATNSSDTPVIDVINVIDDTAWLRLYLQTALPDVSPSHPQ